jgi:hypothetical protein
MLNISEKPISQIGQTAKDLIGSLQNTNLILIFLSVGLGITVITFFLLWFFFWRKSRRLKVFIRLPSGKIERFRCDPSTNDVIGKDGYPYILDPIAIKDHQIEYFWHNPNPIGFDANSRQNQASIIEQNLKAYKDDKSITEFVTAGDWLNVIKILIIITMIFAVIGGLKAIISYFSPNSCDLSPTPITLNTIYTGNHMTALINITPNSGAG